MIAWMQGSTKTKNMNASCRIPATAVGGELDIVLQKCRAMSNPRIGPRFSEAERVAGTYAGATNAEQSYDRNVFNQSFVASRTAAYNRAVPNTRPALFDGCPPRFISERLRLAPIDGNPLKAAPFRGNILVSSSSGKEPSCPRGISEVQRLHSSFFITQRF